MALAVVMVLVLALAHGHTFSDEVLVRDLAEHGSEAALIARTSVLQLHTFQGIGCVACRGQRCLAEECDPASQAQRFRYNKLSRELVHASTGDCIRAAGTLEGELVQPVACGNHTEGWDVQQTTPTVGGTISAPTSGLCLSYDTSESLAECDRQCASAEPDILLARACVRQCLGGVFRGRPLYAAKCDPGRADQYWRLESLQPVECELSQWKTVSNCSAACGGGVEQRKRIVRTQAKNGAAICHTPTLEQPCNTQPCTPVSCAMDQWGAWSSCSQPCGGGHMRRQRGIQVHPQHGGSACGALTERNQCNTQSCDTSVVCEHSEWGAWQACSSYCGGGTSKRTRTLLSSSPQSQCGHLAETRSCSERACHQDCLMTEWSAWGACYGGCGSQQQQRHRKVLVLGRDGGRPCSAPLTEARECARDPHRHCGSLKVHCVMSPWTAWSKCSDHCGGGWQSSARFVELLPRDGGDQCPTDTLRTQECNLGTCAVDCETGAWSSWSQCSDKCDGTRMRTRPVLAAAHAEGKACAPLKQHQPCNPGCVQSVEPEAEERTRLDAQVEQANHQVQAALEARAATRQELFKARRVAKLQRMRAGKLKAKAAAERSRLQRLSTTGLDDSSEAFAQAHVTAKTLDQNANKAAAKMKQLDEAFSALSSQALQNDVQLEQARSQAQIVSEKLDAAFKDLHPL